MCAFLTLFYILIQRRDICREVNLGGLHGRLMDQALYAEWMCREYYYDYE